MLTYTRYRVVLKILNLNQSIVNQLPIIFFTCNNYSRLLSFVHKLHSCSHSHLWTQLETDRLSQSADDLNGEKEFSLGKIATNHGQYERILYGDFFASSFERIHSTARKFHLAVVESVIILCPCEALPGSVSLPFNIFVLCSNKHTYILFFSSSYIERQKGTT